MFAGGFSTLASPLTKLMQKAVKFQWSDTYARVEVKIDYYTGVDLTGRDVWVCGKANVVGDALCRKSIGSLAHLEEYQRPLAEEVHWLASLGVCLANSSEGGVIVQNRAQSSLVVEVKEKQYDDPLLVKLNEGIHKHKIMSFSLGSNDGTLRERIMTEAHNSKYSVHPGCKQMYHDLNEVYWWIDMKRDVAEFVARCPNYQQVKAEYQRSGGLAQNIEIPI
ncbi:uncharacterized protein [Nicotiana tomentosiformis]|uniref:uncharacterized protein n=1 Tax=Nicotiana tomentosiformis TaxID=4098 RepID=UPI00388C538A